MYKASLAYYNANEIVLNVNFEENNLTVEEKTNIVKSNVVYYLNFDYTFGANNIDIIESIETDLYDKDNFAVTISPSLLRDTFNEERDVIKFTEKCIKQLNKHAHNALQTTYNFASVTA